MNKQSNKQTISFNEGHEFKKEVSIQLIKYLEKLSPEIEVPIRAKGITENNYYEVDIHVSIKGKGLFGSRGDIWAECAWRNNSSIRESDIQELIIKAQDAFKHVTESGGFYYDALIMVSNQDFDVDALSYANLFDVLCLRFYQGQLIEKNAPINWLVYPAWMKQQNYLQSPRS